MKVEAVSPGSADFLDVHVQQHNGCYMTKAKIKPSSLARPLGEDSAHMPHIHQVRPADLLRSTLAACARDVDRREVQRLFVERFKKYGASDRLVQKLLVCSHLRPCRYKAYAPMKGGGVFYLIIHFGMK